MYQQHQARQYQQQQGRPGQGWGGGGRGQQQEVRVLSSSGFGVSRGGGVGGQGGGYIGQQQQGAAAQSRGMPGHYRGNVVIAGSGQEYRSLGHKRGVVGSVVTSHSQQVEYSLGVVGGGAGLHRSGSVGSEGGYTPGVGGYQRLPISRSQSLSTSGGQSSGFPGQGRQDGAGGYPVQGGGGFPMQLQRYSQQSVQLVTPQATLPSNYQHRAGQVFSTNQMVNSPYRQVPNISYQHQQAINTPTPIMPSQRTNASANKKEEASVPANPFLSAFEKSFESFLNTKYSDMPEDQNSTENISSILYDSSISNTQTSNPLNVMDNQSNIGRQPTLPKHNSYSQPKPRYTPTPQPRTLQSQTKSPIITKPLTFVQAKPSQSKSFIQPKNQTKFNSTPQPNRLYSFNSQGKPLYLASNNSHSNISNISTIDITSSSPQVRTPTASNFKQDKVQPSSETVVLLDDPEEVVLADTKPLVIKPDPERKFQCDSCPKAFKSGSHLREHEITHTGHYPFNCETCKKGFKRENTLNSHKCLIKEEKVRPHKCEECNKGYATKKSLLEHKCNSSKEGVMLTPNPRPQKRFSIADGNTGKKIGKFEEEEELIGDIIESVDVEVPVVFKCSEIVFNEPSWTTAMIIGDIIEYQDLDINMEDAEMAGWEIEVIGDVNIIMEENIIPLYKPDIIPDGLVEIAKDCGLAIEEVKDTLDFFTKDFNDNLEKEQKSLRFPWQEIPADHETETLKVNAAESKDELLLGDEKTSSFSTLDELDSVAKSNKSKRSPVKVALNKFTYFNDNLETAVGGGSGEDSDDDWTLGKNKCNLCKKKFSTKWHLKQHLRVHSERQGTFRGTYKCKPCKKTFKRKDLRDKHLCDKSVLSGTVDDSFDTSVLLSSDNETLDEKSDVVKDRFRSRQSMLLHSTLM